MDEKRISLKDKVQQFINKIVNCFNNFNAKTKARFLLGLMFAFLLIVIIVLLCKVPSFKIACSISKLDKIEVRKEDCTNLDLDIITLNDSHNVHLISSGGAYYVTGSTTKPIVINAPSEKVYLLLDDFTSDVQSYPAIYCIKARKLVLTVKNEVSLTSTYNAIPETINGCIYSRVDTVINGTGTLEINGTNVNGIHATDDLVLYQANINIKSQADVNYEIKGIKCNDRIIIDGVYLEINVNGDGIKSGDDNVTDKNTKVKDSIVSILSGTITIASKGDGIDAKKRVEIKSGTITIQAGYNDKSSSAIKSDNLVYVEGGTLQLTATTDCGIKADMIYINGGEFNINATKGLDAASKVYCMNGSYSIVSSSHSIQSKLVYINNGNYEINAGNKGIESEDKIIINNGTITIKRSVEGMESPIIKINNGTIKITASDDGININCEPHDGMSNKFGGSDSTQKSSGKLVINGGKLYVNASGDGLDSNDKIIINGGIVLVNGPTDNGNGSLDYDTKCVVRNNAILIAIGSSGMAQDPSKSNGHINASFSSTYAANTLVSVYDNKGNLICAYKSVKSFSSFVLATRKISSVKEYDVYVNGTIDSEATYENLYLSGTVTGAKRVTTVEGLRKGTSDSFGGGQGGGGNQGGPGGRGFIPFRKRELWLHF